MGTKKDTECCRCNGVGWVKIHPNVECIWCRGKRQRCKFCNRTGYIDINKCPKCSTNQLGPCKTCNSKRYVKIKQCGKCTGTKPGQSCKCKVSALKGDGWDLHFEDAPRWYPSTPSTGDSK